MSTLSISPDPRINTRSTNDLSMSQAGPDTIVVTVGPASGTDLFEKAVDTFGEATQSASRKLVLDLTAVDRINSDLLGLLLWAHGRLRMRGAELVVARPSRATREMLGRSGLDFVLTITDELPVAAA